MESESSTGASSAEPQGIAAAAAALERALGDPWTLTPPSRLDRYVPGLVSAWNGAGLLLIAATAGGEQALFLLPADGGMAPDWCAHPDESGKSRLQTLARELGATLLPAEFVAESWEAAWAENLAAAVAARGVTAGAALITLAASRASHTGALSLLWPRKDLAPASNGTQRANAARRERFLYERIEEAIPYLPSYSRSLLKIKTSLRVTLAATKLSVRRIVDLAPGAMIPFPKACNEALDLEVGQQVIARGEAVKVGEKFGLRITAMVLPVERFAPLAPASRDDS